MRNLFCWRTNFSLEYLASLSKLVRHIVSTRNYASKRQLVAVFILSGGEDLGFGRSINSKQHLHQVYVLGPILSLKLVLLDEQYLPN